MPDYVIPSILGIVGSVCNLIVLTIIFWNGFPVRSRADWEDRGPVSGNIRDGQYPNVREYKVCERCDHIVHVVKDVITTFLFCPVCLEKIEDNFNEEEPKEGHTADFSKCIPCTRSLFLASAKTTYTKEPADKFDD